MAGWRVLTPSSRRDSSKRPVILVKHSFQAAQYTVYLTDLVHMWQESLDRKSIIKRALQEDTSIDPSEGTDQLKLLLQHIKDALNGDSGSLKLQAGKDAESLRLELTVDLPVPLQPLLWTLDLEKKPNNVLFEQMQVPLFEHVFKLQGQLQSMLSRVSEKDNVIARLLDKLEGSGVDIPSIFPAIGSIRGSKSHVRETLLKSVPGLRPFEEADLAQMKSTSSTQSKEDVLGNVFAMESEKRVIADWTQPDDSWWKQLDSSGDDLVSSFSKESQLSVPPLQPQGASKLSEEDFQVQDISKLSRFRGDRSKVLVEDSQPPKIVPGSDDDATTEEDDEDLDKPPSASPGSMHGMSFSFSEQPPKSPAKKLGMLGGRSTRPMASPSPVHESMEVDSRPISHESEKAPEVPRRKLGTIGGRQAATIEYGDLPANTSSRSADERPSRSPIKLSKTPPRETSTERADRKREELRRDLEEKRKAPPKKKRKF